MKIQLIENPKDGTYIIAVDGVLDCTITGTKEQVEQFASILQRLTQEASKQGFKEGVKSMDPMRYGSCGHA
jgi:hypothetical protein